MNTPTPRQRLSRRHWGARPLPKLSWRPNGLLLTVSCISLLVATAPPPAEATFPDHNGRIAFRRFLNEDRTWGAIFTIKPNRKGEQQVTFPSPGFVDRDPDYSPDGRKIVFQREGETSDEIWVVNADGSHLTQLTHPDPGCLPDRGTCDREPSWSPDGELIAFSRDTGTIAEENKGIWVMNADGTGAHQLTQLDQPGQGFDRSPQFSPDGHELVFERDNVRNARPVDGISLWVLNLRTGTEHRITPYALDAGDTPDWSPDGQRILFHNNESGDPDVSANLYTVRPDGTGLRQLTFETGGTVNYLGASFSPDGRYITAGRRPESGGTNADVLVMRADATGVRNITRSVLYDSYPDWGPHLNCAHHKPLTPPTRIRTSEEGL